VLVQLSCSFYEIFLRRPTVLSLPLQSVFPCTNIHKVRRRKVHNIRPNAIKLFAYVIYKCK
jgi:hypothetical protein